MPDEVVAAAAVQPEAVLAGVGQLAVLQHRVPEAEGRHHGQAFRGALLVQGHVGGEVGVRVLEGQSLKAQVLDELPGRGIAPEAEQRLPHGRGHDRRRGHVLAGQGPVAQHPRAALEVPLARLVQSLGDILHVVARVVLPPVADRPGRLRRQSDGMPGLIQLGDEMHRCRPGVVDDDHGIAEVPPAPDVLIPEDEATLGLDVHLVPGGVVERRQDVLSVQVALVRGAGTGAALAVDEELVEDPGAGLHRRDLGRPQGPLAALPARDRSAAGEDRLLARVGGIGHRRQRRARVRRRKLDGLLQPVCTATQTHRQCLRQRSGDLESTDLVPRSHHRGKRAIVARGIRLGQAARPGVVPLGRYIEHALPLHALRRHPQRQPQRGHQHHPQR